MGTYYFVYAEAKVGDRWFSLGPYTKDANGGFSPKPLYWAQSIFREVYLDLSAESTGRGIPDDASDDLAAKLRGADGDFFSGWDDAAIRDYYEQAVFSVNFDISIAPRIKKDRPFKYHGYVDKHLIASYECGEVDEIEYWLTEGEYSEADEDARKSHAYYEWNNWYDKYGIYSEIYSRVKALQFWFYDNAHSLDPTISYSDLDSMQTRLIVDAG